MASGPWLYCVIALAFLEENGYHLLRFACSWLDESPGLSFFLAHVQDWGIFFFFFARGSWAPDVDVEILAELTGNWDKKLPGFLGFTVELKFECKK